MNVTMKVQDQREAVWDKLSKEVGGEFINREGWAQDHVRVQHEQWQVTLDFNLHAGYRSEYIHTRFRSSLRPSAFRLRVFHQDLIHTVGGVFGMQDLQTGDKEFDRTFVVQATDEEKGLQLFQDAVLRELMLKEPELEIRVRIPSGSTPVEGEGGCDELSVEVPEAVEDLARLRGLFDVFAHLARELREEGAEPC